MSEQGEDPGQPPAAEPAAPAPRHPFTSIFLVLFLVDALVGVVTGVAILYDPERFDPQQYDQYVVPFSLGLLMGAMIQTSLAFVRRMRWSARIIGLYVVGYWALQFFAVVAISLIWLLTHGGEPPTPEEAALPDALAGALTLAVGFPQVLVGLWAARDLSRGHYLVKA